MASFINVNGSLQPDDQATVMADDRAFRFGYGLFESMLFIKGNIHLEALHWERLFKGMVLLEIESPAHFAEELSHELRRTVMKNRLSELCRVRVQVSAGRGGVYDESFAASYLIEALPLTPSIFELNENGLVMGLADVQKHTSPYANLKMCNALPLVLAARQAKKCQWNDALLANERGNLVESTIANLFWISRNKICTPPLSEGCIAGVLRSHLLAILPGLGYEICEQACTIDTLQGADAVFLSNSIRGIRWVKAFRDSLFDPGPVIALHAQLRKNLAAT